MSNVRSRIYDHLMPPPEITAEEKKEVLDTILEPVSMIGLNLFKDE